MSIRVLVADDQDLVRTGLRLILGTLDGIEVVGEARDGQEAVRLARELRPDVCLMDIRMPVLDGVEATRQLAGRGVEDPVAVVVITTFDLDEYVHGALSAGATGFLLKDAGPELLGEAIRAATRGDSLISPSITRRLLATFEAYPDLKADATMRSLSEELVSTENRVGFARQAYNDEVLAFNDAAGAFPALLVARVFGFEYATLGGHVELGRMDYEVVKWLDDGAVEFRIHAHSRASGEGMPWQRLGFRLFGRREQVRFYHRCCERIARLTEEALGVPEPPPATALLRQGADSASVGV